MRIHLGDFFPRTEHGWSDNKGRRCHKLGAHAVELQGGIGMASLAAEHGDGHALVEGLRRTEHAAEELLGGLPESKDVLNRINHRARTLRKIAEPYQYEGVPKKVAKVIEAQLRELGPYELKVEGQSIVACGGRQTFAHFGDKDVKLEPLSKIPPQLQRDSDVKRKRNDVDKLKRAAAYHAKVNRDVARWKKKAKK